MQLRMKDASDFDIARDVERAKNFCEAAGAQLIVNDFWRAAIDAGCDYVHLGQGDLDTADMQGDPQGGNEASESPRTTMPNSTARSHSTRTMSRSGRSIRRC